MKVTITISCDNAAFSDGDAGSEVARILGGVINRIDGSPIEGESFGLYDINGDRVGIFEVDE